MIDQTFSHFKILSKLGEGGMGVVYKAQDTTLDRIVALKFLPDDIAAQKEAKRRFIIEAKAAAALNHPNIATIYQIEEVDGKTFIVMEYVDGRELREIIANHPGEGAGSGPALTYDAIINITIQIAEGLQVAHKKGITHRDIKSANIMLTSDGRVKIMDFGLAKLSGQSGFTKEGTTLGTVAYMSPEQAAGEAVDQRTDIWSFGVVLYEMLTGQRPFQGEYEHAVIYAIMNVAPKPLSDVAPFTDARLQYLLDKTLAKEPEHRYQNFEAVLADLRDISGISTSPPLIPEVEQYTVGREKEIAELQENLQSVFIGKGQLIGVAGEPGIGKTTLVEQFLEEVKIARRPCLVAKGQCSERLAGTEAYLPFLEALESLLRQKTNGDIPKLMRERSPWWFAQVASLSPDDPANTALLADVKNATQERVKRELASILQEVTARQPLLLLFEDLHWADVSTIDMLAYLAARFENMYLLMIVTYRPAEMKLTKHPFLQIKPDLLSRGRFQEIMLNFLSQKEVSDYLSLKFPAHTFPKSFPELIHNKTEGSPLFMVDLLQDLQNREMILEADENWQLMQSVEEIRLELPDSVKGMIERKIQQLHEDDHRLLLAACIQGFEFDSAVVGKVLEMDEEEVEDRLQKLEQDHHFVHFIEEDEYPDYTLTLRYRFVHALYQNELYNSLMRTKRARLSKAAAEALEVLYGEKVMEAASTLGALFETARNLSKAVDYFGKAAQHAVGLFAFQEAITLATRGLELLKDLPESEERNQQELFLQACLGGALSATRGYADKSMGEAYSRVYELSQKLGLTPETAVAASGLVPFLSVTLQLRQLITLNQELLALAKREDNLTLLSAANSGLGFAEQFLGNFIPATAHFEQVVEIENAQRQDTGMSMAGWETMVYTLGHLAYNTWVLGYPEKAIDYSIQARKQAEESRNPFNLVHYFGFGGFLHQNRGDVEKIHEISEESFQVCEENAFHLNMAWTTMQEGWAIGAEGDLEKGLTMLQEGLVTWRAVGMRAMVPYWHNLIAEIYGKLNQPQAGLTLIEESLAIIDETDHRFFESDVYRMKGELFLLQEQEESQTEALFRKALEIARAQEAKSYELRAAISLSRLWQRQDKEKEAGKLLSEVYNWFTEGLQTRDLKEAKVLLSELR